MDAKPAQNSYRKSIEDVVRERAMLDTEDKVCNARKDARMETLLQREYHGRFLVELLQNARDAWLLPGGQPGEGLLRVRLAQNHTLVVGNTGAAIDDRILLYSLCKTGESTKRPGEGIGHKGIGFKSVLEVSERPEVHSRETGESDFPLTVRFDRRVAVDLVQRQCPQWQEIANRLPSHLASAHEAPAQRIPVFDFPSWCTDPSVVLGEFASYGGRSLNTVIALPYTPGRLSDEEWTTRVRAALSDLSDPVFVLLGAFREAIVEDELTREGSTATILTSETCGSRSAGSARMRDIKVKRDGVVSSRWWIYTDRVTGTSRLDGEVSVAVRLEDAGRVLRPRMPADSGDVPSTFHLFFPTNIPTGLPFILHAYFEVDAGRKSFAEDEVPHNQERLEALKNLLAEVVADLCLAEDRGEIDLRGLADLFAEAECPIEENFVRRFHHECLAVLDRIPWVRTSGDARSRALPAQVLSIADSDLMSQYRAAFPTSYLHTRLCAFYPDDVLSTSARMWLSRRSGLSPLSCLEELLLPGAIQPWQDPEAGFLALLEVLKRLEANYPKEVRALLDKIGGNPNARLIPVVAETEVGIELLPPITRGDTTDDVDSEDTASERAIFARRRRASGSSLIPPACLSLAFVRDELLEEGHLKGMAGWLGVREYVTRDILDRIGRLDQTTWTPEDRQDCARFVFKLLLRERESEHSISEDVLASFTPGAFVWCVPGRVLSSRDDDLRIQRRAHRLSRLHIPNREGIWCAAESLAFGAEWANFFRNTPNLPPCAQTERAAAYDDLAALAPQGSLVAPPESLRREFPLADTDVDWEKDFPGLADHPSDVRHMLVLFLWLQRLGVWEVPPVSFRATTRDTAPQADDCKPDEWWNAVVDAPGHFSGYQHRNARLAENFRFQWPLKPGDAVQLRAIARGFDWYSRLKCVTRFCNHCQSHKTRYTSQGEAPSTLWWELRHLKWIPNTVGTNPGDFVEAGQLWWDPDPPRGPAFSQSWLRFLPLAPSAISQPMAHALGFAMRGSASPGQIRSTLAYLKTRYSDGAIARDERDAPKARQAFIAAHVRLYGLLQGMGQEHIASVVGEMGVLAERGNRLEWVKPAEARHDDGDFAAYRRLFAGRLPFLGIPRRDVAIAQSLGVLPFRVKLERLPSKRELIEPPRAPEEPIWLRDALSHLLAILAYVPVGGEPITVGSDKFTTLARRLAALRVSWVPELIQRVTVEGIPELSKSEGEHEQGEVFLDITTSSKPVLFHDFDPLEADSKLRMHLGAVVAKILESPGHADTFALYFQLADEARPSFLLDRGIGETPELKAVQDALQVVGLVARDEERRWWQAVIAELGVSVELPDGDGLLPVVREALARSHLTSSAQEVLIHAGGYADVRYDVTVTGPLALLERERVDLRSLHIRLRSMGDEGLEVRVANDRLVQWKRVHGHKVVAVLTLRGIDAEVALRAPDRWSVPEHLAFRIDPSLTELLDPVIASLLEAGCAPDPERLAVGLVDDYLAELAGSTRDELDDWVSTRDAKEAAAERARSLAQRWRAALAQVLVAVRCPPGELSFRIQEDAKKVDEQLRTPSRICDLEEPVRALLPHRTDLASLLTTQITEGEMKRVEPPDFFAVLPVGTVHEDHRRAIEKALDGERRARSRELRQAREILRAAKIVPSPPPSLQAPIARTQRSPGVRSVPVGTVRRNPHRLTELGRAGERWAVAAVIDAILALLPGERRDVLLQLHELLTSCFSGEAVDRHLDQCTVAMAVVDDDYEFELALKDFLHLSLTSDRFGCDLLGWLAPGPGQQPRPLFLEVKNDADRSFPVSRNEWDEAGRLREDYAFLVVFRGARIEDAPRHMELIVDPAGCMEAVPPQITVEPDGYLVSYQTGPASAAAAPALP